MYDKQPESLEWTVEFYTVQECGQFIEAFFSGTEPWHEKPGALDIAEAVAITLLTPRFNRQWNPSSEPLPERYGWLSDADKRRLRDQVSY